MFPEPRSPIRVLGLALLLLAWGCGEGEDSAEPAPDSTTTTDAEALARRLAGMAAQHVSRVEKGFGRPYNDPERLPSRSPRLLKALDKLAGALAQIDTDLLEELVAVRESDDLTRFTRLLESTRTSARTDSVAESIDLLLVLAYSTVATYDLGRAREIQGRLPDDSKIAIPILGAAGRAIVLSQCCNERKADPETLAATILRRNRVDLDDRSLAPAAVGMDPDMLLYAFLELDSMNPATMPKEDLPLLIYHDRLDAADDRVILDDPALLWHWTATLAMSGDREPELYEAVERGRKIFDPSNAFYDLVAAGILARKLEAQDLPRETRDALRHSMIEEISEATGKQLPGTYRIAGIESLLSSYRGRSPMAYSLALLFRGPYFLFGFSGIRLDSIGWELNSWSIDRDLDMTPEGARGFERASVLVEQVARSLLEASISTADYRTAASLLASTAETRYRVSRRIDDQAMRLAACRNWLESRAIQATLSLVPYDSLVEMAICERVLTEVEAEARWREMIDRGFDRELVDRARLDLESGMPAAREMAGQEMDADCESLVKLLEERKWDELWREVFLGKVNAWQEEKIAEESWLFPILREACARMEAGE